MKPIDLGRRFRVRTLLLFGVVGVLFMVGWHLRFCSEQEMIGLGVAGYAFGVILGLLHGFVAVRRLKRSIVEGGTIVIKTSRKLNVTIPVVVLIVVLLLVFAIHSFKVYDRVSLEGWILFQKVMEYWVSFGTGLFYGYVLTTILVVLSWVIRYERRNGVKLRREIQYV